MKLVQKNLAQSQAIYEDRKISQLNFYWDQDYQKLREAATLSDGLLLQIPEKELFSFKEVLPLVTYDDI